MDGNGLKNKSLNKNIKIYQLTLMDRICGVLSGILFPILSIIGLIRGAVPMIITIIIFLFMIVYCVFVFLNVFKTYICLDIKNNKLIIREALKYRKEEFDLKYIISIEVTHKDYTDEYFTIDIHMPGYTKKIDSWSGTLTNISFFAGYKRQIKRLIKFCEECNKYLNNK